MNNETPMHVWNWNNAGKLIAGLSVASMDEARRLARDWNRRHRKPADQVAIITDTAVQAHATRITTI